MRPVHLRLVAIAGALAVVLGVATAFVVGRDDPAQPTAVATPTTAPPTDPADVVARDDAGRGTANPETTAPKRPGDREQAAKAAAVAFLRELGMRDPVAASYRATGAATAEVGLHPKAGEGGRLFDKVTTLVQLRRYTNGWVATGARALDPIDVAQPRPFARILSPLTVSGVSLAYEGTVHVTVTEDRRGPDRVLGKGFVTGGGAEPGPFRGPITFTRPTADAGWVVFSGDTAAGTGIVSASAVRVRFGSTPTAPRLVEVATSPAPAGLAQLVALSGTGKLWLQARASGATEVRFLLVPSGTGNRPNARLLGTAHHDGDGRWSLTWRYPDEPFTGHLLVQVKGPGGSVEDDRIGIYHT
jgi:hypothetical protein